MNKGSVGILWVLAFFFVGCADMGPKAPTVVYRVAVSSFGNSAYPPNSTFAIRPGNPSLSEDDPEFREYASYLERTLELKGFRSANPPSAANFEVTLNYGISDGSTVLSGAETGGVGYAWNKHLTTYNSRTSYRYDTTYQRTCQVVAFDLTDYQVTGQMKQVWRTQMISVGPNPDLRRILPILLAAGYGYLGLDSGEQQEIVLSEDDPAVERLRGGMTPPQP